MKLAPGHSLIYVVRHEAVYGDPTQPEIYAESLTRKGESDWSVSFIEREADDARGVKIEMWDDSVAAFTQAPELFAGIATLDKPTLGQIREVLDAVGAEDITDRAPKG